MKLWHFSEGAYPYLPPEAEYSSVRVTMPNRVYDPKIGAELYHRFLDEWLYADEEGLDLQINEHHQTPTCVDPAAPIVLGILARQTKRARLLVLGNPIGNRSQPVRVAEEMAMVDVLFARPRRMRLRARRAVRDRRREQQPGAAARADVRGARPHRQGLDDARRPVHLRGPVFPSSHGQYLAAPLSAAASADLDRFDEPARRRHGRRARLHARHVLRRPCRGEEDLRRLSRGLDARRARRNHAARPARLCLPRLYRRHRRGRPRRRAEAAVVPEPQQDPAAFPQSAGLCPGQRQRAGLARRHHRTGRGLCAGSRRSASSGASSFAAIPIRSIARSSASTTMSAASATSCRWARPDSSSTKRRSKASAFSRARSIRESGTSSRRQSRWRDQPGLCRPARRASVCHSARNTTSAAVSHSPPAAVRVGSPPDQ